MAVSPVVIKAVITAATDKRTWKALAILLAAIFMPLILLILMIAGMFSGVESANNDLLDYSFVGTAMPDNFTDEQCGVIEDMRDWLGDLDDIISEKENDEDCSLDGNMVRAAFYCLNFGGELDEKFDFESFCDCFDGLTIEQLETALQNVLEEFSQYVITENIRYSIPKVYEYLMGKELT
ncbi:MAG: hypothetical protein OSJ43_17175 [Oscillospiraceae bacterium]|nr:hypothetical protein [Oscillospiraceae bacterium]